MPESLGMRTVHKWHREQLLRAHLRMEQCNALCLKRGQIPTTLTTSLTCNHAREDVVQGITAMDTPCHHDPEDPQHPYPFHPGHYLYSKPHELWSGQPEKLPKSIPTWRLFTSHMQTLSHWLISCPVPSKKTMKIPSKYCLPTLPKGWVYEDIEGEVKQEVLIDPMSLCLAHSAITPQCPMLIGLVREHQSKCRSISRSMRGTR